MKNRDEKWSLFWCTLLKPILFDELEEESEHHYMKTLSEQEVVMPDGRKKKPSLSTLKLKLKEYREGGFSSLFRKPRSDRGKIRGVEPEVLAKAIEIKKEQPLRSDETINRFLQEMHGKSIAKSTLYRHLKQAGATRLKLGISQTKVRKRWSREHTNALWGGDFEKGPYVLCDGKVVETHLSLFIDYYSRYVVEAKYYLSEGLDILIDSLLRAWATHGSSQQLYLDNAKIYISDALRAACVALNIDLMHRPVRDPAAGGLVERMFLTIQNQFEAEVRAGNILSLDQLNRNLNAYLSVSYHQRVHSETRETPHERYHQGLTAIRHVDINPAIQFFMKEEVRKVDPDFSDVRLQGLFYRVDPGLRGEKIIVKYDPYGDKQQVWLYSTTGQARGKGLLHQREEGEKVPGYQQGKPAHDYLQLLVQQHDKKIKAATQSLDYRNLVNAKPWPFNSFAQAFARLMGRTGGLSSFNADELQALETIYQRHPAVTAHLLEKAFENAPAKNIVHIAYELQLLFERKENLCS